MAEERAHRSRLPLGKRRGAFGSQERKPLGEAVT